MSWQTPPPNWDSPGGQVLDAFLLGVHQHLPDYTQPLTLFGSAAIQLCLDESFTSADIDVMVISDDSSLRSLAKTLGLGRTGSLRPSYGIQICPIQLFRTTPHYLHRARMEQRHGITLVIPHLRDVLLAKLHRFRSPDQEGLVPKDRRAFERVRELCAGHPTESDLLEDLVLCEPYLGIRSEDTPNAFRLNVLDLFLTLFNRQLDIEKEILQPARSSMLEATRVHDADVAERLAQLRPDRD